VVPGGVFCCCSPSASRLCVLWLHKCFTAYLGCNEGLFQSKCLFYQLESVGPFSKRHFRPQDCRILDVFPFSQHSFFVILRNGCALKIPVTEQIVKYTDTNNHATLKIAKSHFFPILTTGVPYNPLGECIM